MKRELCKAVHMGNYTVHMGELYGTYGELYGTYGGIIRYIWGNYT